MTFIQPEPKTQEDKQSVVRDAMGLKPKVPHSKNVHITMKGSGVTVTGHDDSGKQIHQQEFPHLNHAFSHAMSMMKEPDKDGD